MKEPTRVQPAQEQLIVGSASNASAFESMFDTVLERALRSAFHSHGIDIDDIVRNSLRDVIYALVDDVDTPLKAGQGSSLRVVVDRILSKVTSELLAEYFGAIGLTLLEELSAHGLATVHYDRLDALLAHERCSAEGEAD
jgi:hypothetical protein